VYKEPPVAVCHVRQATSLQLHQPELQGKVQYCPNIVLPVLDHYRNAALLQQEKTSQSYLVAYFITYITWKKAEQ
jgi:hypothetical protein